MYEKADDALRVAQEMLRDAEALKAKVKRQREDNRNELILATKSFEDCERQREFYEAEVAAYTP